MILYANSDYAYTMDLVLAMDLKEGSVVHGKRGDRAKYRPLTWGISPTADPAGYLAVMQPRFLYIADLDRIAGTGSHDAAIASCARRVECCYVDRGCRSPDDLLTGAHIVNVVGTETAGDLSRYRGGMLSLDVRDGLVLPKKRNTCRCPLRSRGSPVRLLPGPGYQCGRDRGGALPFSPEGVACCIPEKTLLWRGCP